MRWFFILCLVPLLHCFNIIPSVVRSYTTKLFFDSRISTMHKNAFTEALTTWKSSGYCDIEIGGTLIGLEIKNDGLNTITYNTNTNMAASNYYAQYNPNIRSWVLTDSDVIINPDNLITYSAAYNAFLHEIGHLLFLEHDGIPNSVMNNSISAFPNGTSYIMRVWNLHPDNMYGSYVMDMTSKYYFNNSKLFIPDDGDTFVMPLSLRPILRT